MPYRVGGGFGGGLGGPLTGPRLPDAVIPTSSGRQLSPISTQIPAEQDIDRQIKELEAKIAGLPVYASHPGRNPAFGIYQSLTRQLAALRQQQISHNNNGIPPAPEASGTFLNQIVSDKIGLEDLTIPLP